MNAALESFLRHKWKFVIVTILFWAGAAAWYFLTDPPCVSKASVMVRYIVDLDPAGVTPPLPLSDVQDSIMKAELEILTSRELAEKVVKEIGADRLARGGGEAQAVSVLSEGLEVKHEKGSAIIVMSFRHLDAETAQATLQALMKTYFTRHLGIHRTASSAAILSRERLPSLALLGSAGVFVRTRTASDVEAGLIPAKQIPNISTIQNPTPPVPDPTRRNQILAGMIAGGPVTGLLVVLVLGRSGIPRKDQLADVENKEG